VSPDAVRDPDAESIVTGAIDGAMRRARWLGLIEALGWGLVAAAIWPIAASRSCLASRSTADFSSSWAARSVASDSARRASCFACSTKKQEPIPMAPMKTRRAVIAASWRACARNGPAGTSATNAPITSLSFQGCRPACSLL